MNIRLVIVAAWLLLILPPVVLINVLQAHTALPYPAAALWASLAWINTACLAMLCWSLGQREAARIFVCILIGLPIGILVSLTKA